jgi:hypothetical protein
MSKNKKTYRTKPTDEYSRGGDMAMGIGKGAASGAATGMMFGPWGAGVGLLVGGAVGGIKTDNALNAAADLEGENFLKSEQERMMISGASQAPGVQFAMGGPMGGGSSQGEQLNQFNGGGTHEQNPQGGIPMGNGQSVEEGETELTSENYVFSDRLYLNEQLASEFGYDKKHAKKTIAQLSKDIDKKYGTRSDDTIDENSKKLELDRLMEAQEFLKAEQQEKDLAKFAKAQPEMFAQMQMQAQQQQQQPQHQMPDGSMMPGEQHPQQGQPQGMPQGPQMGQPGQMSMGGYRNQGNKQYSEGGPLTDEQKASLQAEVDSGRKDQMWYDIAVSMIERGEKQKNGRPYSVESYLSEVDMQKMPLRQMNQKQNMPDLGGTIGVKQNLPDNYDNYDNQLQQLDDLYAAGKINAAEYSRSQAQLTENMRSSSSTSDADGNFPKEDPRNIKSETTIAREAAMDDAALTNVERNDLGKTDAQIEAEVDAEMNTDVTAKYGSQDVSVEGAPEQKGFNPGMANSIAKLAPIAFNLFQGLKPEDRLNAGDYKTKETLEAPTMNIDPMLRSNQETYQGQHNAIRSASAGSGATYLANMGQAQLNRQKGDANAYTQKSNYDNQMQMGADQFNIGLDQKNNSIQLNIDDWNMKSKANKESHLSDAASNAAGLGQANTQDRANAYGLSQQARDYEFMFSKYIKNNKK